MPKNMHHTDFVPHDVRDWEKAAQQELGKMNPWADLTKRKSGQLIKPYYHAHFFEEKKVLLGQRIENIVPHLYNAPKILVDDEKTANSLALHHLNSGADAVFFHLPKLKIEAHTLLKNIELMYCAVFFESESTEFLTSFQDFAAENSDAKKMNGAFFLQNNASLELPSIKFRDWGNFHFCGFVVKQNENIVDEIVDSLLTAVEFIDQLTDQNFSVEQAFRAIAFSIALDPDFFLSIAKIRVIKSLWLTLQQAYRIAHTVPPFIHVHSLPWIKESYQPHGNMLKQTTAAMAAVIGGCHALTIDPEIAENKMMTRIARNVSSILHEESHLSLVNDPLAGSYYLEALSDQIAGEAWRKFQSI